MVKINIPTFKLNNGKKLPALGFGTWLGLNENFDCKVEDAPKLMDAMSYAIDIGYRHFDTAHFYRIEPEVGEVVRQKIAEGVVTRDDLFITTKVWQHNHREADAVASVEASVRRMGLDYVDMALIHWPMSISQDGEDEKIDYLETWRGMETTLRLGLTKSIGVSNFNVQQMQRLLANCTIKPVVNQFEVNLNFGQNELVSYCQSNDVVVIGFTTFGSMVGNRGPKDLQPKLDNPTMLAIGKKYGKLVTQIALRYLYQRNIATIPKSISKQRVLENASIFDFELTRDEMATLAQFDNGYQTDKPVFWQNYTHYPFEKVPEDQVHTKGIPTTNLKWMNGMNKDIE